MANLNIVNNSDLDARYTQPADVDTKIAASLTDFTSSLDDKAPIQSPSFTGTVSGVTASMVGLSNVTNTADMAKPVSTAQAQAISAATFGIAPRVGFVAIPPGFISSASGAPSSGQLIWYPFSLSLGYTVDALYINVATAQTGGTTSFQAAVYKDDGTGWPDGTQQAIAPQIFTLTSTGNVAATLSTPVALSPGRYWIFVLYQVSSAPTVAPAFQCLANTTWSLPAPTTVALGLVTRGYVLASQSAFPSATIATTGVTLVQTGIAPVVGFHRSA